MEEVDFVEDKLLNCQYSEVLAREEIFWRQTLRECWLKEGDQNTNFFHNLMEARRSVDTIHNIKNAEGNWLVIVEDINKEVVSFFKKILFAEENQELVDYGAILGVIPHLFSEE